MGLLLSSVSVGQKKIKGIKTIPINISTKTLNQAYADAKSSNNVYSGAIIYTLSEPFTFNYCCGTCLNNFTSTAWTADGTTLAVDDYVITDGTGRSATSIKVLDSNKDYITHIPMKTESVITLDESKSAKYICLGFSNSVQSWVQKYSSVSTDFYGASDHPLSIALVYLE